jgi:ribose transport system ATP-binding protein
LQRIAATLGIIKGGQEKREVYSLIEQVDVNPKNIKQKVSLFSGGNQQKIVICKGLFTKAEVYIFVEPTAGVDVGAKAGIFRLMRDLSKRAVVILVSSDCKEVFGMSDHAMAMFKGRVTLDKDVGHLAEEELLLCGAHGGEIGEQ